MSFSGGPEDFGAVPKIVMRVLDVDLSPMGATAPISIYVGMPLLVALIFLQYISLICYFVAAPLCPFYGPHFWQHCLVKASLAHGVLFIQEETLSTMHWAFMYGFTSACLEVWVMVV